MTIPPWSWLFLAANNLHDITASTGTKHFNCICTTITQVAPHHYHLITVVNLATCCSQSTMVKCVHGGGVGVAFNSYSYNSPLPPPPHNPNKKRSAFTSLALASHCYYTIVAPQLQPHHLSNHCATNFQSQASPYVEIHWTTIIALPLSSLLLLYLSINAYSVSANSHAFHTWIMSFEAFIVYFKFFFLVKNLLHWH